MFGRHSQGNNHTPPARRAASDVARIEGGGLVQLIVTAVTPLTYFLFLNDRAVSEMEVESLSVAIETPTTENGNSVVVRATLARYVTSVSGERSIQRTELFPSTLEIVALGRRISITCTRADSLDGLWVSLGLKSDGTGSELTGLQSVHILLTAGLLDAKLTWQDGETENILPLDAGI